MLFRSFVCGPNVRPLYLAYWFLANKLYLDLVANGSTYPEIYKSDLFEFTIAVPDLASQDRAIAFLSSLDFLAMVGTPLEQTSVNPNRTQRIHSQSVQLERIRKVLLPAVLSGAIDLSAVHSALSTDHAVA